MQVSLLKSSYSGNRKLKRLRYRNWKQHKSIRNYRTAHSNQVSMPSAMYSILSSRVMKRITVVTVLIVMLPKYLDASSSSIKLKWNSRNRLHSHNSRRALMHLNHRSMRVRGKLRVRLHNGSSYCRYRRYKDIKCLLDKQKKRTEEMQPLEESSFIRWREEHQ